MQQRFFQSCRARGILTARYRFAFGPEDLRTANRAFCRKNVWSFFARAPLFHHGDDLGDDISAAFDENMVSGSDVFSLDLVFVVKS